MAAFHSPKQGLMATAKNSSRQRRPRGSSSLRYILFAALVIAGLALAYRGPLAARAQLQTAYGARIACSCRFVAGRELGSCRADFEPGMGLVMLSEDSEAKSVTATVPLLASDTATWRRGWGCVLETWRD